MANIVCIDEVPARLWRCEKRAWFVKNVRFLNVINKEYFIYNI